MSCAFPSRSFSTSRQQPRSAAPATSRCSGPPYRRCYLRAVLARKKIGLGAPMARWLRGSLGAQLEELVLDDARSADSPAVSRRSATIVRSAPQRRARLRELPLADRQCRPVATPVAGRDEETGAGRCRDARRVLPPGWERGSLHDRIRAAETRERRIRLRACALGNRKSIRGSLCVQDRRRVAPLVPASGRIRLARWRSLETSDAGVPAEGGDARNFSGTQSSTAHGTRYSDWLDASPRVAIRIRCRNRTRRSICARISGSAPRSVDRSLTPPGSSTRCTASSAACDLITTDEVAVPASSDHAEANRSRLESMAGTAARGCISLPTADSSRRPRVCPAPSSPAFVYQRASLGDLSGLRLARHLRRPLVLEYNGPETWVARHWGEGINSRTHSNGSRRSYCAAPTSLSPSANHSSTTRSNAAPIRAACCCRRTQPIRAAFIRRSMAPDAQGSRRRGPRNRAADEQLRPVARRRTNHRGVRSHARSTRRSDRNHVADTGWLR